MECELSTGRTKRQPVPPLTVGLYMLNPPSEQNSMSAGDQGVIYNQREPTHLGLLFRPPEIYKPAPAVTSRYLSSCGLRQSQRGHRSECLQEIIKL